MNKAKIRAAVIIFVLLLLAAAIAWLVTGNMSPKEPAPTPAYGADDTENNSQPPETQTPPPVETPELIETPEPTPTPLDREIDSQGSFASDTGTPLNLLVNWSAKSGPGETVEVTFEVYLRCYSINASAKADGLSLSFNGQTYRASTQELNMQSNELVSVELLTQTASIELPQGDRFSGPVTVDWAFGGSYSSVDLDVISASGAVEITG